MDAADALVNLGLRDAGYNYVNIDGGWQGGRHSNGTIYPNSTHFPNGLLEVADYIREQGLRFGQYTDKVCLHYAGGKYPAKAP